MPPLKDFDWCNEADMLAGDAFYGLVLTWGSPHP